jgi:hypothetical protein
MVQYITELLTFVYRLVLLKEHNVSETGPPSVFK